MVGGASFLCFVLSTILLVGFGLGLETVGFLSQFLLVGLLSLPHGGSRFRVISDCL